MKKLLLLILPFFLLTPSHGSLGEIADAAQDKEYTPLRVRTAHKFVLDFVRKHAAYAQTWEDALEKIFDAHPPKKSLLQEDLEDYARGWLEERATDPAIGLLQKNQLPGLTVRDISPELQRRIYRFSNAQNTMRAAFEAQWDAWRQHLGPQEPGAFCAAFLLANPEALPNKFEDFSFYVMPALTREWEPTLTPHVLIGAPLCMSLEGLEAARHIVRQDIATQTGLPYISQLKVEHLHEMRALQDLRTLLLVREPSYFTKEVQPWPLLETLKEILPHLRNLETLQLPVLGVWEEDQAKDLLSVCGHLKQVILSRFMEDLPGAQETLDPEVLFDALPKGAAPYLREEGTLHRGAWSVAPKSGGVYPYAPHTKSYVPVAPHLDILSDWRVNSALLDLVIEQQ
ncbi:MAG: hypothetical protein C0514_03745 [Candidatus Puniceispirillum sp.]|nr:hypothetical protein [Candidatus Puniceispirillum sp.]